MNIEFIRPVDNAPNQYEAVVDGVPMRIATRPGQVPEEVLADLLEPRAPSYAEKRLQEYPPVQEQLDMIYHDIDGWREKIAAIKARNPRVSAL